MCDVDNWMKSFVSLSLHSEDDWLSTTFRMCQRIKIERQLSDYGFEWAIQTLLGNFLLAHCSELGISNVRLNQTLLIPQSHSRYDCSFDYDAKKVVIELKSVVGNGRAYILQYDLEERFRDVKVAYFLIVNYPVEPQDGFDLHTITLIARGQLVEDFGYSLYRVNRN